MVARTRIDTCVKHAYGRQKLSRAMWPEEARDYPSLAAGSRVPSVASGAGTRAAAAVPPAARAAVTHAARAGTASGLNDVLLAAAAFAALGAVVGFAYGPDPAPARQPPPSPAPGELSAQPAPAQHQA